MLTNGTTVAATTVQEDMMQKVLGLPANYGRAIVLGPTDLPADAVEGARMAGLSDEDLARFEAYVIEPRTSDGDPITAANVIEPGATDAEAADLAYVAILAPDARKLQSPVGEVQTVVLAAITSKSQYLASFEARVESEAQRAYSELEAELFALAEQADDDDTPEFLD